MKTTSTEADGMECRMCTHAGYFTCDFARFQIGELVTHAQLHDSYLTQRELSPSDHIVPLFKKCFPWADAGFFANQPTLAGQVKKGKKKRPLSTDDSMAKALENIVAESSPAKEIENNVENSSSPWKIMKSTDSTKTKKMVRNDIYSTPAKPITTSTTTPSKKVAKKRGKSDLRTPTRVNSGKESKNETRRSLETNPAREYCFKIVADRADRTSLTCGVCTKKINVPIRHNVPDVRSMFHHASKHLGKTLFKCKICKHGSVTKDSIQAHIRTAHWGTQGDVIDKTGKYMEEIMKTIGKCYGQRQTAKRTGEKVDRNHVAVIGNTRDAENGQMGEKPVKEGKEKKLGKKNQQRTGQPRVSERQWTTKPRFTMKLRSGDRKK